MTVCLTGYAVNFPTTPSVRMISAGPEAKADAINLGPSSAVFQNGRAEFAEKRNAVTVWRAIAQKIATTTNGK